MIVQNTKFKDLKIIQQKNRGDSRGNLRETFKKSIIKWDKLVFDYATTSKKNVLRGFHFQSQFRQAKYVSVLKGKIIDCAIDLRKKSETFGKVFKCILSEKNSQSIFIPPGFAHGFCGLEKENYIIYSCTQYRDKASEKAIKYNDKKLNIKWPIKKPIVSKKHQNAITFIKFKKKYL